ncbi:MAG: hypothetical protein RL757_727 [Bacteroidota bacterium]
MLFNPPKWAFILGGGYFFIKLSSENTFFVSVTKKRKKRIIETVNCFAEVVEW